VANSHYLGFPAPLQAVLRTGSASVRIKLTWTGVILKNLGTPLGKGSSAAR